MMERYFSFHWYHSRKTGIAAGKVYGRAIKAAGPKAVWLDLGAHIGQCTQVHGHAAFTHRACCITEELCCSCIHWRSETRVFVRGSGPYSKLGILIAYSCRRSPSTRSSFGRAPSRVARRTPAATHTTDTHKHAGDSTVGTQLQVQRRRMQRTQPSADA